MRTMVGYGQRPRPLSGPVGSVAKNVLARGSEVSEPNRVWVTDITFLLHFYQGTQFTSEDWQCFLREHDIVCSLSRRGN